MPPPRIDPTKYWQPPDIEEDLCEQMTFNRFQEITRSLVHYTSPPTRETEIMREYQGKWYSQRLESHMEVTVQLTREYVTVEDRVKFLQEAAIMGQFKHRHIERLYGVVTIGEPVSLTICEYGPIKKLFHC